MAMIMCPECGKMFSNMANACPNCGLPIQAVNTVKGKNIMYCSECGGKLEAGARFCMGCGAKVERREIDYNVSVNKEIKEPIVSNHNNQTQPVRAVVNTNMKFENNKPNGNEGDNNWSPFTYTFNFKKVVKVVLGSIIPLIIVMIVGFKLIKHFNESSKSTSSKSNYVESSNKQNKSTKISFPDVPMERKYTLSGIHISSIKINSLSFNGTNKITADCEKTYDWLGKTETSYTGFTWKLYDSNNYLIESGSGTMSMDAVVGDKQKVDIYLWKYDGQSNCTLFIYDETL